MTSWVCGAEQEGMKFLLAKAVDHLEPGAPWRAAVDFDGAGDQHLLTGCGRRARRPGCSWVRNGMIVSLASTRPLSGSRSGLTMALAQHASKLPLTMGFWRRF